MGEILRERRKYQRYDLETRVHFFIKDFKLVTKVKFRVFDKDRPRSEIREFSGISRNVSVEGLRFTSAKKLKAGDSLFMKVYLPKSKTPIPMVGEVRWSRKISQSSSETGKYNTGVMLLSVNGRSVARSIHIDRKYNEPWSIVLDSVFGSFHKILHKAILKAKTQSPGVILKAMESD